MQFIKTTIDPRPMQQRLIPTHWLTLALLLVGTPALAQTANFGSLTLTPSKTVGSLSGTTGGSTSLPAITSNTDQQDNRCLGFGDPNPDHILILQEQMKNLTLQVSSGEPDTTLVIQGPNGVMHCADNIASRKPVTIHDTEWQAGSYRIWVGTAFPGVRRDYTLTVKQ